MAFENITMNLTALEDITPPDINISGSNIFTNIISQANTSTNDYLIFGSLTVLFLILYFTLSDKTPFQDFGYDDLRAINISLACSSLIGLTLVSVEWSNNFKTVGIFIISWLLSYLIILIYENIE